ERDAILPVPRNDIGDHAHRGPGIGADLVVRRTGGDVDAIAGVAGSVAIETKPDVIPGQSDRSGMQGHTVPFRTGDRETEKLRAVRSRAENEAGMVVEVDLHDRRAARRVGRGEAPSIVTGAVTA